MQNIETRIIWTVRIYCVLYAILFTYINLKFIYLEDIDENAYITFAMQLQQGKPYLYAFNPFGYSGLIFLLYQVYPNMILMEKLIDGCFIGLFLFANFETLVKILPKNHSISIASFSVLIWSINYNILYGWRISHVDLPYSTVFILIVYCFYQDFVTHKRFLYWGAFFTGILCLFRWTGLFYVPFILLFILVRTKRSNAKTQPSFSSTRVFPQFPYDLKILMHFLVPFLIIFGPWLIYNAFLHEGNPFYNQTVYNLLSYGTSDTAFQRFGEMTPQILMENAPYILIKLLLNLFVEFPVIFFRYHTNLMYEFTFEKIMLSIMFYLWFYVSFRISRKKSEPYPILYGIICLFLIQISLGWILVRFLYPLWIIIIALLLYPIFILKDGLWNSQNLHNFKKFNAIISKKSVIISLKLVILIGLSSTFIQNFVFLTNDTKETEEYVQIGAFLKGYSAKYPPRYNQTLFAVNGRYYSYYSDLFFYPDQDFPLNIAYYIEILSRENITYLIISERLDIMVVPELSPYLNESIINFGQNSFLLIYATTINNYRIVVFERQ